MKSTTVTEKIAKNSRGLLLLPHTVYSSVQLTMFKWVWNGDGDFKKCLQRRTVLEWNLCGEGLGCRWNQTGMVVDGNEAMGGMGVISTGLLSTHATMLFNIWLWWLMLLACYVMSSLCLLQKTKVYWILMIY